MQGIMFQVYQIQLVPKYITDKQDCTVATFDYITWNYVVQDFNNRTLLQKKVYIKTMHQK